MLRQSGNHTSSSSPTSVAPGAMGGPRSTTMTKDGRDGIVQPPDPDASSTLLKATCAGSHERGGGRSAGSHRGTAERRIAAITAAFVSASLRDRDSRAGTQRLAGVPTGDPDCLPGGHSTGRPAAFCQQTEGWPASCCRARDPKPSWFLPGFQRDRRNRQGSSDKRPRLSPMPSDGRTRPATVEQVATSSGPASRRRSSSS